MNMKDVYARFFQGLIFLNVFLIIGTFRARELGDDSMDWQVVLKLGVWLFSFCAAVFVWRVWILRLVSFDNFFLSLLLVIMFVSCFYAPSFNYSVGATFSVVAIIGLYFAGNYFLSHEQIALSTYLSLSLIGFISIIVYFVDPEVGRMKEWVGDVEVPGPRLAGITGTANGIGFSSAFALMIAACYFREFWRGNKVLFTLCALLNLVCLVMSQSRSSMLAMMLSLGIAYFANLTREKLLIFCAGVLGFCLFLYLIDIETLMVALSRSGNAEEIETGTGRTFIWNTTLRLIGEKPFLGYGYASSVFIFPKLEHEIGHAPPNAHNLVLQVLFSIGFPGLFVFCIMFFTKVYYAFRFQDFFKIALLSFLFINGLTEAVLFRGTVSSANIMFALAVCLEYSKSKRQENHETNNTAH